MIPQNLRTLFWDINFDTFNPGAYPKYTIFRILESGDENAVAWMRQSFSESEIEEVIRKERRLSRRAVNFWALVYRIPTSEVAALKH